MKRQEESVLQRQCVAWFRLQHPNALIFAIPNGGSRHKLEAVKLKAEGVLAGIPDLQVILQNKVFFIEMKTQKGSQTPNQKQMQEKINSLGFNYFVCRSFEDFQEIIKTQIT